ncbi:DUF805 domain-containing protein [Asticcacaulis sp. YBE204]|uniref:DUF805 domain-containing protein n=1 Tax=Asticcacaulis sp. YBE204 TaxID=1282363 RepID=UPI0003C3C2CB|nr:DUF805 domain-containing protein [Asticcacaulis sp. YBE204]ESQ77502.1 hypothetical protein AEYBE204_17330 [Asticcacaulis sp. YBE204]
MKALLLKPLRHYGRFRGRSGRAEFWAFIGAQTAIYAGLITLLSDFGARLRTGEVFSHPLLWVLWLLLLTPNLALCVRRLHDLNLSGLWVGAPWVVSSAGVAAFNLSFRPKGPNPADAPPFDLLGIYTLLSVMIEVMAGLVMYVVLPFVVAQLIMLLVAALPGNAGENRYGRSPN